MRRTPLPYFGSVSWWTQAVAANGVELLSAENYQRRSERNRTLVASPDGPLTLSIPLVGGKHNSCPIQEAEISYRENWPRTHFRSLRTYYGSAPFWPELEPELTALYASRPQHLWDWNWACLTWMRDWVAPGMVLAKAEIWDPETDVEASASVNYNFELPSYPQVFSERTGYLPNLSALDLLLCQGPAATAYLARAVALIVQP